MLKRRSLVDETMDLLEFTLYYLGPVTVAVLVGGMVYKFIRYVALARVHTPKPEFRWREHVEKHAGIFNIGFWHWVKGILEAFLRPIIWSIRVNIVDFIGGLLLLHIVGVLPILFLRTTHVAIWLSYIPFMSLGALNLTPLIELLSRLAYRLSIPGAPIAAALKHSLWGPLGVVLCADVLTILAVGAVVYKLIDHVAKACRGIINIRPGDIAMLLLLLAVLLTGFTALHLPDTVSFTKTLTPYLAIETVGVNSIQRLGLGLHVLFAEILVMALPFSKFSHILYGYWYGKLHEVYDAYAKRGV